MFFKTFERSDSDRLAKQLGLRTERRELLRQGKPREDPVRRKRYGEVMQGLKAVNDADIYDVRCQIADLRADGISPREMLHDCIMMCEQTPKGRRLLVRAVRRQARRLAQVDESEAEQLTRSQILYRVRKLFTPIQYLMHGGNPMPIVLTKNGERIPTRRGQFIKTYKGWYVVVDIIDFDHRNIGKKLPPMRRRVLASPCSCNLDFGRTDIVLFEEIEEVSNKSPEEREAEYDPHEHMLWWYANHHGKYQ